MTEADIYRASLLVHNTGTLNVEQRKEPREWIAARPGGMKARIWADKKSSASQSGSDVPFPLQSVKPLESINVLLNTRGALYEGDIFSVLWRLPFVIRSFEFALADGALDCGNECAPDTSYADRIWTGEQRRMGALRRLLLFDVKSKAAARGLQAESRDSSTYISISLLRHLRVSNSRSTQA